MKEYKIVSHLTPREWRYSWNTKVIDDKQEKLIQHQFNDAFWGHFENDKDFIVYFHQDGEVQGMSIRQRFNGHLEAHPDGCQITGTFSRKKSADLLMCLGAVLCTASAVMAFLRQDTGVFLSSFGLLIILVLVYFIKPQSGQDRVMEFLKKVSFDHSFHRSSPVKKVVKKNTNKKGEQPAIEDSQAATDVGEVDTDSDSV